MILVTQDILFVTLIFARVMGLVIPIPVWGGPMIPAPVRVALWGMFAVMLYPLVFEPGVLPSSEVAFVLLLFKELFVGLLMGFAVRILFEIAQGAGSIISMEIGLSMSTTLDPISRQQNTTVGNMLYFFCFFLFFVMGIHHDVLEAFVASYIVLGIGAKFPVFESVESLVQAIGAILTLAVQIAAPMIAMSFVVNLTFSILGKAAPKINVFIVSFAFRIMAGLFLLLSTVGLVVQYLSTYSDTMARRMLEFLGV